MRSAEHTDAELERAGIRVERNWLGAIYIGTRDAIVGVGLLTPEQVPGEPACPKTHVFRFEREGRPYVVSISRKRGLVKFCPLPTQEQWETWREQREAIAEAERVAEDACKSIAALPRSREAYGLVVRVLTSVRSARESLLSSRGGYSLPERAVNEFVQAVDMALDELLEHVTFSRAAREREIAAWRQKAADADPAFARFMQAASAQPNE